MRALWLLVAPSLALANPLGPTGAPVSAVASGDQLVADLTSDVPGDRKFAAREIRREMKRLIKAASNPDPDEFAEYARQEARVDLHDLRQDVRMPARRCLEHENVRATCADILALTEDKGALEILRVTAAVEEHARTKERLQAAITTLEALP